MNKKLVIIIVTFITLSILFGSEISSLIYDINNSIFFIFGLLMFLSYVGLPILELFEGKKHTHSPKLKKEEEIKTEGNRKYQNGTQGKNEFTEDDIEEVFRNVEDSTLIEMQKRVRNGEYQEVINIDEAGYLSGSILESKDLKKISEYSLLVGASYQEVGELKIADKYYDLFLSSLTLDNITIEIFKKSGIEEISEIKMMMLIKSLEELGISYKFSNKES